MLRATIGVEWWSSGDGDGAGAGPHDLRWRFHCLKSEGRNCLD
jgi:hypothetical protein